MTIEKEEPGIWVAYCDSCGERVVLDNPVTDPKEDCLPELEHDLDWRIEKPEVVKFHSDAVRKRKVEFEQHFCPDC